MRQIRALVVFAYFLLCCMTANLIVFEPIVEAHEYLFSRISIDRIGIEGQVWVQLGALIVLLYSANCLLGLALFQAVRLPLRYVGRVATAVNELGTRVSTPPSS